MIAGLVRIMDFSGDFVQRTCQQGKIVLFVAKSRSQSRQTGIDSIKEIFFVCALTCGNDGANTLVKSPAVAGVKRPAAGALRELMPQAIKRKCDIRFA